MMSMEGMMVSTQEWVDLVVDLRSAIACGTLGNCQALEPDDPERNRIHQATKTQVHVEYAGWVSEGENDVPL